MKSNLMKTYNVDVLSENELKETDGGFIWMLAYAINTTLVAGTLVGLGAAAVAGFNSGYDTVHEILN